MSKQRWNVSIWVSGASRPVESLDFTKQDQAEAYAERKREQIKRTGSTHRVSVGQVICE